MCQRLRGVLGGLSLIHERETVHGAGKNGVNHSDFTVFHADMVVLSGGGGKNRARSFKPR